jgi:hypothetical protein
MIGGAGVMAVPFVLVLVLVVAALDNKRFQLAIIKAPPNNQPARKRSFMVAY